MQTIKEQIESRCIHFTGLGNDECKCGVKYQDVRDPVARPFKIPCFKDNGLAGGKCDKVEFPSEEYVAEQVKEIDGRGTKMIKAVIAVKAHINNTREMSGKIQCPVCGELELRYGCVESNGHTRGSCKCGISWME